MVRLPEDRVRKVRAWLFTEACPFLESARADNDPVYPGYVLMLVLGLHLGDVLGLPRANVNLDAAEVPGAVPQAADDFAGGALPASPDGIAQDSQARNGHGRATN